MKAYRKDGNLVIEISEAALLTGSELIPVYKLTVTDSEKFLDFCVRNVCVFGDDGDFNSASALTRLLDDLVIEAYECDAGIEPWDGEA
jgi:hypothetical protein